MIAMRIANDIPLGFLRLFRPANVSRVFDFVYRRKRAC